jgi:hypothetical protein
MVCEKKLNSRVGTAFKRHLLDPVDFAFFGLVAIILVKTRDDHKRLGDMVADSHIVRESDLQPDPVPEDLKEVQDAQH